MAEVLGGPLAGDATDLVARLLLLYPASPSAPVQPWSTRRLLVVDGHVLALSEAEYEAACRHMAGRLDALFPDGGGVYDLRTGRFAVVVERHTGLRGSLSALVALIESHDVTDVAAWLEPLPDDPELIATFVRGVRTKPVAPAPPATVPLPAHDDAPASVAIPRTGPRGRARASALVSAGAAVAVAVVLTAVMGGGNPSAPEDVVAAGARSIDTPAAPALSPTPGEGDSLADLGYQIVEESAAADGTQVFVLEPTAPAAPGALHSDQIAATGGAPSPITTALPDAVVVAVGTAAEDALALVNGRANPTMMIVGVPAPSALPADLAVIVAVRGPASPDLCAFLQAVPSAEVVGDPVSCDLELPDVPSGNLPTP